jgi:hypothetical protein
MRWTSRESSFILAVRGGERVCAKGFAPSLLYRNSWVGAAFSVKSYIEGESISAKDVDLMGKFRICSDPSIYEGPVRVTLSCHDGFYPDDVFHDGDRQEKCLQLLRVWAEKGQEGPDE